jgi:hypothetical protein
MIAEGEAGIRSKYAEAIHVKLVTQTRIKRM